MARSLYDMLEVAPSASPEEIRAAYRRQIALYHPDKVAGLGADLKRLAEQKAKEINAAYATLRDTAPRAAYDRQLRAEAAPAPPPPPPRNDPPPEPPEQPRPTRGERRPPSPQKSKLPRPRVHLPFRAIKESGKLALFAAVVLVGLALAVSYTPRPIGWFITILEVCIGLLTLIVFRGLFFLGLWAVLFLDVRAPNGRIITLVSRLFRVVVCMTSGLASLFAITLLLAGLTPSPLSIGQPPPFQFTYFMATFGGLTLTGAGWCLASLMPTRIGRRFA